MYMIDEVEEEFSFDETLYDKLCSNTPFNL
jgi:hypothetical protein